MIKKRSIFVFTEAFGISRESKVKFSSLYFIYKCINESKDCTHKKMEKPQDYGIISPAGTTLVKEQEMKNRIVSK